MSAPTPQMPSTTRSGNRGRKHRGGRPKNQREPISVAGAATTTNNVPVSEPPESEDGAAVCWICAEPVKYYSLSECNHRTCHVCALRLRALYKRMDCTFCKHPQTKLIFTQSPDELFEAFTPEHIPFKDTKLSISFETQDMMEETLILLRFNCPDSNCDFIASGWGDLKMHVRAVHRRSMCDLCIRFKKVFAHEHVLYQPSHLPLHLPSIHNRAPQGNQMAERVEGGVHPICEFCRECFFGDDELFAHMRERHEECFLCKRAGIRDQYFLDYAGLERHFNNAHFPCRDVQCQAQKFVVFDSALDLKAHTVELHGGEMSSRDKKDARRIETGFDYEEPSNSGGGSNRRQGRNRAREREREPPEPGPSRSRRRDGFGAALTSDAPSPVPSPQLRQRESDQSPPDVDPATAEKHAAFIERVNLLTSNSTTSLSAIKSAVRSYRSSESGPRDLISTIFNVVNQELDSTASLINALVELLDDQEKRTALLAAWNGFKLEQQRQFPDLTPSAPGAEYAGVTGGRVLNVKQSAAVRSSSTQSPRQVWDRVAQAAASSSSQPPPAPAIRPADRFPTLAASRTVPGFRQPQHTTAWSSGGAAAPSSSGYRPAQAPAAAPAPVAAAAPRVSPSPAHSPAAALRHAPPKMSAALFPTLPSSSTNSAHARPAVSGNQSLRHILGENGAPPAHNPWGGGGGGKKGGDEAPAAVLAADGDGGGGGGGAGSRKKKKGKEKQMLFTLGTFPT